MRGRPPRTIRPEITLCQPGDILEGDERWVFAVHGENGDTLAVGWTDEQKGWKKNDNPYIDLTRVGAKYLVLENKYAPYSDCGHSYPGQLVTCQRLNYDGTQNPDGELIQFFQTGMLSPRLDDPKVVGKMKEVRYFVPA
jgi:hypothetical protein